MARNERVFQGPIVVADQPAQQGELWAVGSTTIVAFIARDDGRLDPAAVANNAVVGRTVDGRLLVTGDDDVLFAAAAAPEIGGAWMGLDVSSPDGTKIAGNATVQWSNQGVTVAAGAGNRWDYPGARTVVSGASKWIEQWTGIVTERLLLVQKQGGCRSCGG